MLKKIKKNNFVYRLITLLYFSNLFDEIDNGAKIRKTVTIYEESFKFLENLASEMSFKLKEKCQIAHALKYLEVNYTDGISEFREYQQNFKEIRDNYNLSLRGPVNNGKTSTDRQLFIQEIKELKPPELVHILPNMSTCNTLAFKHTYFNSYSAWHIDLVDKNLKK